MPITPHYATIALNFMLTGTTSGSASGSLYLALFTGDPTLFPSLEVAAGDYARHAVTFATSVNARATNSADVTFSSAATADYGTVTHWAIFDALTNGNLLFYDELVQESVLVQDAPVVINAGTLVLNLE